MSCSDDWIAVDWGTTSLRAWLMSADGQVLAQQANQCGMNTLKQDEFESQLLMLTDNWLSDETVTKVLICGMAGSREGWIEAPYAAVPVVLPNELSAVQAPTTDLRHQAWILPGLMQAEPPNVMRGEETQIAGFLQEQPDFTGVVVLPGTHTKWVQLNKQTVLAFTSVMTGELFNLLSQQSILRHTVSKGQWQQAVFDEHLLQSLQSPVGFAGRLFDLRAARLLHGQTGEIAFAKLSAELVALELAAVQEKLLQDEQVPLAVIGNDHLAALYKRSLELFGYEAQAFSGDDLSLSGLRAAYQHLFQ